MSTNKRAKKSIRALKKWVLWKDHDELTELVAELDMKVNGIIDRERKEFLAKWNELSEPIMKAIVERNMIETKNDTFKIEFKKP